MGKEKRNFKFYERIGLHFILAFSLSFSALTILPLGVKQKYCFSADQNGGMVDFLNHDCQFLDECFLFLTTPFSSPSFEWEDPKTWFSSVQEYFHSLRISLENQIQQWFRQKWNQFLSSLEIRIDQFIESYKK